jgi:hypothetical protein
MAPLEIGSMATLSALGPDALKTSPAVMTSRLQNVTGIPQGFPQFLHSPLAWCGNDFENDSSYILHLSNEDKKELESALSHFKCNVNWNFTGKVSHY